jgi:maltose-binding protein MalE
MLKIHMARLGTVLLAAVAVALLILAPGAPAARDHSSATTITIWVDNVQKPAVDKIVDAWGRSRGVTGNVLIHDFGKIRDDLKTVKAENAPDIIVGPHDWVGDLAANGLVVPLFPKKAVKAQFPGYALQSFSYGTTTNRLYGAPFALENVGLAVNLRLAHIPKSFADFEKQALAFKRKSSDNIALAVPQGSGGDAYHMYPFFSGLGGYVFGRTKAGTLNAKKIGVANKTFLKNAGMIDKWNREGLINSKIDYGTAKNAFVKQNAAFWITGPWEADTLKTAGFPVRVVQLPKIKFRSVPFLGVQGFMVTKFAAGHAVGSLAKDLVGDYMMKSGSQRALAAANGRFPANKTAGKSVTDSILKQFGRAGVGGVPMPNIPQMGSVWSDLGGAWVKATKGAGATPARTAFTAAARAIASKIAAGG